MNSETVPILEREREKECLPGFSRNGVPLKSPSFERDLAFRRRYSGTRVRGSMRDRVLETILSAFIVASARGRNFSKI